jgi:hypothetical protein
MNGRIRALHTAQSCCCFTAICRSSAEQFFSRQAEAADFKAVLVHIQVTSVLEKEERMREGGPAAVGE